ncbi:MAG TPA: D-amino acid aminotransferase [Gammaproteobacteria bacterium]|nr:D-amino acid aminotransferase [Gammaproteobacteria bacterium]
MPNPLPTAWFNGRFLPLGDISVSPLDRGFLFGDGIYEVIPAYGGRLFRFDAHLARLRYSLGEARLDDPYSPAQWREVLQGVADRNGGGNLSVYLQVTRGAADMRDHRFPSGVSPTVFAMASPLAPMPQQVLDEGVTCITCEDIRWRRCDIKTISLLGNVLLRQQAEDAGAAETILLMGGCATEGSASTLFIVDAAGTVCTPPKDKRLLPGITRDLVLELARDGGLAVAEREIRETELRGAGEIWLASSTREVVAVTSLDNQPVGDGRPGTMWRRVWHLFQDYKQTLIAA